MSENHPSDCPCDACITCNGRGCGACKWCRARPSQRAIRQRGHDPATVIQEWSELVPYEPLILTYKRARGAQASIVVRACVDVVD